MGQFAQFHLSSQVQLQLYTCMAIQSCYRNIKPQVKVVRDHLTVANVRMKKWCVLRFGKQNTIDEIEVEMLVQSTRRLS